MALTKQRTAAAGSLIYIPIEEIRASPVQPRRCFAQDGIDELAASIEQFGVIQPLTVRTRGVGFELVAGERRLRAAAQAGLREVPCIIMKVNMEESSLIALIENLQRRDLHFIEEAEGIAQLIKLFGMSQEEVARKLGKSQSAVANKLRILKLPEDVRELLRDAQLTERHGRALLRLPTSKEQRAALCCIITETMNVAAAESYIDSLLSAEPPEAEPKKAPKRTLFVLKDVRLFLNTLTRGIDVMKQGGIDADIQKEETDSELIFRISIPKNKK